MSYSEISDEEDTSWFDICVLEKTMDGDKTLSTPTVTGDSPVDHGRGLAPRPVSVTLTTATTIVSSAVPICTTADAINIGAGPSSIPDFAPCTWDFATSRQLQLGLMNGAPMPTYTSPADLRWPQVPATPFPVGDFTTGHYPTLVSGCVPSTTLTAGWPPVIQVPPPPPTPMHPWAFTPPQYGYPIPPAPMPVLDPMPLFNPWLHTMPPLVSAQH